MKLKINLTGTEAKLLVYLINNGVENIGSRDKLDAHDKKALQFSEDLVQEITERIVKGF